MKIIMSFIVAVFILCPLHAQDSTAIVQDIDSAAVPEEVIAPEASLMAEADALSASWKHQEAAAKYLEAAAIDSNNYDAYWKAADELTKLADNLPGEKKDLKESTFQQASDLCDKAIAVNPNGWEGHTYKAIALGRLALFQGGKKKINLSKAVKAEADKAMELNPEADTPYHILGRWHQNLANLSWVLRAAAKVIYGGVPPGSNEEAVAMFKKAIELNPKHIVHYLELAKTYKLMGKKDLMVGPLETLLALPSVQEKDDEYKEEAKAMLKKLE